MAKMRQVHLCTLTAGSRACKGGVQTIDAIGDSSAHDLHVFTTPGGKVTLVWAHDTDASESGPQGSEIATATSQAGGKLSPGTDQATSPSFGTMLDAGMAPNGQIWVLSEKSVAGGLQVRPGLNNPFVNLKTPYGVGAARVAFNHGTPVIVIQKAGAISAPVAYTSFRNGKFAAFSSSSTPGPPPPTSAWWALRPASAWTPASRTPPTARRSGTGPATASDLRRRPASSTTTARRPAMTS